MSDNPFADPNTPINDTDRRKRLRFRAWRRGFREADIIMGRFADEHLDSLSIEAVDEFERLLDAPDTEVYSWINGSAPVPSNYDGPVLKALKCFEYDRDMEAGDGPVR